LPLYPSNAIHCNSGYKNMHSTTHQRCQPCTDGSAGSALALRLFGAWVSLRVLNKVQQ